MPRRRPAEQLELVAGGRDYRRLAALWHTVARNERAKLRSELPLRERLVERCRAAHAEIRRLTMLERARFIGVTLANQRWVSVDERDLQDRLAIHLELHRLKYAREFILSDEDRVDFFVEGGIALEVKVKGATNEVLRQLQRYAQHQIVETLMLVTTKALLSDMPETLSGKPLVTVLLRGFP